MNKSNNIFQFIKSNIMCRKVLLTIVILLSSYTVAQAQTSLKIINPMPTRQVHLDFHTSELIPDIGSKFDKLQWQQALKTGKINSINIFGKGHHGWSYYPTIAGAIHPNLHFDLLGAQIEACHEIGVNCPVYFTVGWSANDAGNHPEWCMRNKDGSFAGTAGYDLNANDSAIRPHYSWICMCPASSGPYHQAILDQVEELCRDYPIDGFWFDIYHIKEQCYCQYCLDRMKKEGVDLDDKEAVSISMIQSFKQHMKELRVLVAKYHPEATVYFNATTRLENKQIFRQRLFELNTHQDLEDLPTTWGGYDKLPLDAKYHLEQGVPVTGMSGKFHKAWGEFGGFEHADAIKYEAAAMISFGATCNFGDQLHPSGKMDIETYKNIGKAYSYVEKIEEYGPGGVPVSNLGVWLTLNDAADHGVVNMLLEMHYDFVVATPENLNDLDVLIIPSHPCLGDKEAQQIKSWIRTGGKLLALGRGTMDAKGTKFLIDTGVEYTSDSPYDFDFTVVGNDLLLNMVSTPFLNYESGMRLKLAGGKALANIRDPYFNRTYGHYSSHRETPYQLEDSGYPAIVQHGNTILFAHNLDQLYHTHGVRLHRELFKNAIDLLYENPVLKVQNLPSAGRVSLLKQEGERRYVVHLLYAPALQRGEVQVIEDFLSVPGVEIVLNIPENITRVYQIPDMKKLRFKSGEDIAISIPEFTMHTGIVFDYE